jgi:hypothetical protein
MDAVTSILLKTCRRIYRIGAPASSSDISIKIDCSGQAASDLIKERIAAADPCMICRFGTGELYATLQHIDVNKDVSNARIKAIKYIQGKIGPFWWDDKTKIGMSLGPGLFPVNDKTLASFGERMLSDIKNIDILGSWLPEESRISHLFPTAKIVALADLEPYYHANPWSEILQDKVVLVINPFEESIRNQYDNRRGTLFNDPRVLPNFQLKTLKAIQSIAGNTPAGFSSWFEALDWMCERVQEIEFDIAIIGAGAYGLPLASFVKNMGKKAVHLGGATQILFGIRGKRWDDNPFFQQLFNENWIKPLPTETPTNFQNVESGCYW